MTDITRLLASLKRRSSHVKEFGDDITFVKLKDIDALAEALEKAQQAANINNQWKPDVCPITGRKFFMWIEHPELGYVPTYGGPLDSYTIPTRDSDGEFSCERYDHDFGGWVDGECVGVYLVDDDEQCRVYELEQSIAELREQLRTVELSNSVLESRTVTVKLPKRSVGEVMHMSGFSRDYAEVWCAGNDNAIHEMRVAGVNVIEGEQNNG
ncbi:ead/Ea22-like family protein [Klebsiella aerogenes]